MRRHGGTHIVAFDRGHKGQIDLGGARLAKTPALFILYLVGGPVAPEILARQADRYEGGEAGGGLKAASSMSGGPNSTVSTRIVSSRAPNSRSS